MAPLDELSSQKDSQGTFVESPTVVASRNPWFKWLPKYQKRMSTAQTLVDIPEDRQLDKMVSLAQEDNDAMLVASPTSFSGPSTPFSPITPDSSIPFIASTASSSSSPSSLKSQKGFRPFSTKSDESFRESHESVRSIATLATKAVLNLAEASNIPYLKGVAGVALLILEYTDGAASNKEECARIGNDVAELMIALEARTKGINGTNSQALGHEVEQLNTSLERVLRDVEQLSKRNRPYFVKFIHMDRDREIIKRCDANLKQAFRLFSVQSTLEMHACITDISRAVSGGGINELNMKDAQKSCKPSCTQRETTLHERCVVMHRLAALPPRPVKFFGRSEPSMRLIQSVLQPAAVNIAILGPGGIGKSSLALELLHNEDVAARFSNRRFFVPCDSATSVESLASWIASKIGLSADQRKDSAQPGEREADILAYLVGETDGSDGAAPLCRTIIVLDNFETPWEPEASRRAVETFLARMAALKTVTVIVTLRGTERPSGVDWLHPFLPPLHVLDAQASRDFFLSVSGADYPQEHKQASPDELDELLSFTGHLPLAIRLMAEIASPEIYTVPKLVELWQGVEPRTSILNNGSDPNYSLEVSIQLSLNSPRIKRIPDAGTLLGLLALLPDGIHEDDVRLAIPHLPNLDDCLIVLLKTALAYRDGASRRYKVLAPIRAYITSTTAYSSQFVGPLQSYLWNFIDYVGEGQIDDGRITRALPELGNIEFLIERALAIETEPRTTVTAAVNLGRFFLDVSSRKPHMVQLQRALTLAKQMEDKKLEADCIHTIALAKHRYFDARRDTASCSDEFLEALELYKGLDDKSGQGNCLHQLGAFYHAQHRFEEARESTEKAYQLHLEASCFGGQVLALLNLAKFFFVMNEIGPAIERAHRALELLDTKHHNPMLKAQCLQFLGAAQYMSLCNFIIAAELLDKSLRIYKALQLEESSNCADTTTSVGELAFIRSRYEEARDALQKATLIYRKIKRRDREAYALVNLGLACLGLGNVKEALDHIQAGLVIWEGLPNKWGIGISRVALGDVAVYEHAYGQAEKHYVEALGCFKDDSRHWKANEAECLLKLGILLSRTLREGEARLAFEDARRLYNETSSRHGTANCNRQLAELDIRGKGETAKMEALKRLEDVANEYLGMGLHIEQQECDAIIAETYRSLGEKPPKRSLHLQIVK